MADFERVDMLPDGSLQWAKAEIAGGTLFASVEGVQVFQELGLADLMVGSRYINFYGHERLGSGSEATVYGIGDYAIKYGTFKKEGFGSFADYALAHARLAVGLYEGMSSGISRRWTAPIPYFTWADSRSILSGMERFDYLDCKKAGVDTPFLTKLATVIALRRSGIDSSCYGADLVRGNVLVRGQDADGPKYVRIDVRPNVELLGLFNG